MQYALQVFEYQDKHDFRIVDRDGNPWFVLADVCRVLDIANPSDAAKRLDSDEKATLDNTEGRAGRGAQSFTIINESGLYSLILTSRKPEAKKFKKWITAEVLPSIRKTGQYGFNRVPAFIRRYNQNWDKVAPGYFSVINELVVRLWGRLEHIGHTMADKAPNGKELRPDVSVGRLFSEFLETNHPDVADEFEYYDHETPETVVQARQYPNKLLELYIQFVDEVWIPEHAERYFNSRDPAALPFLPRLLTGRRRAAITLSA